MIYSILIIFCTTIVVLKIIFLELNQNKEHHKKIALLSNALFKEKTNKLRLTDDNSFEEVYTSSCEKVISIVLKLELIQIIEKTKL